MELLLIRHAVTAANLNFQLLGRTDPPLHELGYRQAEAVGAALRDTAIDAIFTSPLRRAVETATAIAQFHPDAPFQTVADLQEMDLGIVDGWSSFVAYERYQHMMEDALDRDSPDFAFPEGELRSDALTRFSRVLAHCEASYPAGRVVIVTHGGPIGLWLAAQQGLPLGQFRAWQSANAAITRVQVDSGRFELVDFNETQHLPTELSEAIEALRNQRP
jgi:broad specificity phosphatase PhoE